MNSFLLLKVFFTGLKNQVVSEQGVRDFLRHIGDLPPALRGEIPLLWDLGELSARSSAGEGAWGPFRAGLQRRYLRIRFVCQELGKLDFSKAKPGTAFRDFIFEQIDFSVYKVIAAEDFTLFAPPGLEDFDEDFFKKAFNLDRRGIGALIQGAYHSAGNFYALKQDKLLLNPLLMSIMRTLQSSLNFTPLLSAEAILKECTGLIRYLEQVPSEPGEAPFGREHYMYLAQGFRKFYAALLKALDGLEFEHPDGMKTALFVQPPEPANPEPVLMGIFHPGNKAYTIVISN